MLLLVQNLCYIYNYAHDDTVSYTDDTVDEVKSKALNTLTLMSCKTVGYMMNVLDDIKDNRN